MQHGAPGSLRAAALSIVPVACPGCGIEDIALCEGCASSWWEDPFRSEEGAPRLDVAGRPSLPVWSVAPLLGPTHLTIKAWKDGRRRDLDLFFLDAARRAAAFLAPALSGVDSVVPIPAHRRSVRARGVDLTALLAEAAAQGLSAAGVAALVRPLLINRGGESRSLAVRERWLNATRSIQVRPGPVSGSQALLVDDVVTTGSSIARTSTVLEKAGVVVVGALTLAATPPAGLQSHR